MSHKNPRRLNSILGLADTPQEIYLKSKSHTRSVATQRLTLDSERYQQIRQNLQQLSKTNYTNHKRMFRVKSQSKIKDPTLRFRQQIGRIDLLRKGKNVTEDPLKIIFQVLEWFGKNQNFYSQAFEYIVSKLKKQTIFCKEQFDTVVIERIIKITNNDKLVRAMHSNGEIIVSYKEICNDLSEEMLASLKSMEEERIQYQEYIEELNRLIGEKRQTILKMKDTVKYYSHHPSQDLYPYIEQLEAKIKQQQRDIQSQQTLYNETSSNMGVLITTNALLSDKIDQLSAKLYQIEIQKLSGTEKTEKNSELAQFQNNVAGLKSMLDKSVVRMLGMKQQFQRLKNHNQRLVSERSELAKRAAVGFSELTPRPNMKQIFEQNQIQYTKVFGENQDIKISTETLVKTLMSKFKRMYNQFKQTELGKKIILDPTGKPINKFKNPTDEMIKQLKKGKDMIRETEQSAEMLKTKQVRELQKKRKLIQQRNK